MNLMLLELRPRQERPLQPSDPAVLGQRCDEQPQFAQDRSTIVALPRDGIFRRW